MMFGQMTAGSWIYIGSQGIVQGTLRDVRRDGPAALRRRPVGALDPDRRTRRHGRRAAARGDDGRAPRCSPIECQDDRIGKCGIDTRLPRHAHRVRRRGACNSWTTPRVEARCHSRSGLLGNAAEVLPEICCDRGDPARCADRPDVCARPAQRLLADRLDAVEAVAGETRVQRPRRHGPAAACESMAVHVRAMLDFHEAGRADVRLRQQHPPGWRSAPESTNAFDFPGFVPAYVRPLFCRGIGPFRWAALSGDPEDIYRTDAKVKELMPDDPHLHHWLDDGARERIQFQGLPSRICWVGLGHRHRLGLAFNEMVRSGELKAPVVIGRDHLDSGSVASPNRETEAMQDGSDAVSDWAAAQCTAQYRERCHVGVFPSRRRRRHGLFATCRAGHRLRRQRGSGQTYRARPVERPGQRA